MKLSFDDIESFKEAAGSFYDLPTARDPNTLQQMGSSTTMMFLDSESNEDHTHSNNHLNTLRIGSRTSSLATLGEDSDSEE